MGEKDRFPSESARDMTGKDFALLLFILIVGGAVLAWIGSWE